MERRPMRGTQQQSLRQNGIVGLEKNFAHAIFRIQAAGKAASENECRLSCRERCKDGRSGIGPAHSSHENVDIIPSSHAGTEWARFRRDREADDDRFGFHTAG